MSLARWRKKAQVFGRALRGGAGPRHAVLFLTRKCNLRCPYCKVTQAPSRDIGTAEWKTILTRLHGWGVRFFNLLGGEPTLRADLEELVVFIERDLGATSWLISNCKGLSQARITSLRDAGLSFLTCSIDSLTDDGTVKSESSRLELLQFAREQGLLCATLTVITRKNLDEIPSLLETVTSRGLLFDFSLYQHVGGAFSPREDDFKVKDRDRLAALLRLFRRYKLRTGLVSPSWSYLTLEPEWYERLAWKCDAASDRFLVVNNDGCLMSCQEWPTEIPVIGVDALSFPAWRKTKATQVADCPGCLYTCYYQREHFTIIDRLFAAWALARM